MSEKLTREQIEEMRDWLHSRLVIHQRHEDFTALCDLALAGLAVQPRPIEEAPKDEWLLVLFGKRYSTICVARFATFRWEGRNGADLAATWGTPTHFIPLSSLPEVR
jgi:hypothetical protein